ncbi:MAG TPA: TadE family protein [Candidatus Limnocylindria bacterium]|nr:TadE family protein [Candidatus Limnocylindria bacterium]
MRIITAVKAHHRRTSRAQGLVEFALVLPIFLLMLFGIVDLGRYVYMNSTLSQAAREGARLASVEVSWVGSTEAQCGSDAGPVCPADLNELRADVVDGVNRMMAPFAAIPATSVHLSCDVTTPPTGAWTSPPHSCTARASGNLVSVRVVMDYQPITPVIAQLLGTLHSAASATMNVN